MNAKPDQWPSIAVRGGGSFPLRRIFCVGRNYEDHAREMGFAPDREAPFFFTKSALAFTAGGSTVNYPPATANYHHEVELVVALGGALFEGTAAQARDIIFGYACGLDMTRRDLQIAARDKGRPWDLGKDFEQSAIVGEIARAADCGHPGQGRIELSVNGDIRQASDIGQLIHSVPEVIAYLSRFYHLDAGDLIFTGTPHGVGPVVAGDQLEGSVEGIGSVSLHIAPAS